MKPMLGRPVKSALEALTLLSKEDNKLRKSELVDIIAEIKYDGERT